MAWARTAWPLLSRGYEGYTREFIFNAKWCSLGWFESETLFPDGCKIDVDKVSTAVVG